MDAGRADAGRILQTLRALDFVESACLTGSFSRGCADRYSDIDIALAPRNMAPDEALLRSCEALKREHEVLWLDFAPSLMPQKYVASLFFAGTGNPFRYVDIALMGDGRVTCPPEAFANDPAVHLVKLWLMNFKHGLRGSEGFQADFARMLRRAGVEEHGGALDGFKAVLDGLDGAIDGRVLSLLRKTLEEHADKGVFR